MTWHSAICFSVGLYLLAMPIFGATVSGRVELSNASGVAEADGSGVVVWLEPVSGSVPDTPPMTARIAHRKKTFVPHVVAVRTGSKVSFPNLDPFFHNAFSNYDGQPLDVGLRPPHSSPEVVFTRPGIVRLFCNIHPTMSAVIVVLKTPFFAVTGNDGAFSIPSVPAGTYRLEVFHERCLPAVLKELQRQISVASDDMMVPHITISEAGYLPPPHKNKYGKDYPPVIVDQYPGQR